MRLCSAKIMFSDVPTIHVPTNNLTLLDSSEKKKKSECSPVRNTYVLNREEY